MSPAKHLRLFVLVAVLGGILFLPTAAPAQVEGAELIVDKTDAPDPATTGSPLTYVASVENDGPEPATNVELEDILPQSVSFVSATPSQGSCSQVLLVVTCALGTLEDEAVATVAIVVTPSASGTLNNIVGAESTTLDPNPLNNVATETTTVTDGSGSGTDLAVEKADAPDPVAPGGNLTYVITVQNAGSAGATGVILTDVLPLSADVVSISASQGSCTGPTLILVNCELGDVPQSQSATVTLVVTSATEGTILNTATAVSDNPETNPANNLSTASTTVSASAGASGGGASGGGAGGGAGAQGLAACTIQGTALDDKLTGTNGNDVICGLDGNDTMSALDGKDVVIGGNGNDRGNGGKHPDKLKGQGGNDRLAGSSKNDRLAGGAGKDRLNGGSGKDRINGGKGKDRCRRGKGDKVRSCP